MRRRRLESGTAIARPVDVVVVDDDQDAREIMMHVLLANGCSARAFACIRDARLAIAEQLPEIVVTDLVLESEAGADLARDLRSDAATVQTGLIAVSGLVEPDWPVVKLFDAYLRKPLDCELLVDVVVTLARSLRDSRPTPVGHAR